MAAKYKILIMGASYGSLLGTKLGLAGHDVHLICLPAEADLINAEGAIVRMPIKGREGLVEKAASSAVRSIGSSVGRELIRGVLGGLSGGSRPTRRRRY